ncbi:MAG: alpha/beta hydrolase [Owenweeksia sp.]|nr:alpha/beta hydrolase [Owenweeksia sp.]
MKAWQKQGVQYLQNGRTGQEMPLYYQLYEDHLAHKKSLNVEKSARLLSIPWLIIHGEKDESVFVKEAYELKHWQPEAKVDIIPNTGHTFGRSHPWRNTVLPTASAELVESSLDFIKKR